jgi:hypothetical protein
MIPKLIDERIERKLRGIYTACTAVVTLVSGNSCNLRLEDGEDTELFDVPFTENLKYLHDHDAQGAVISKALREGDRVLVVFSKYPLTGKSARRFDINDAIVVAKL